MNILWWKFQATVVYLFFRPLCLIGFHKVYDGCFHTKIDDYGDKDSFKCYHCRYCGKPHPLDRERHKQAL